MEKIRGTAKNVDGDHLPVNYSREVPCKSIRENKPAATSSSPSKNPLEYYFYLVIKY
jgi:hypothetical protein